MTQLMGLSSPHDKTELLSDISVRVWKSQTCVDVMTLAINPALYPLFLLFFFFFTAKFVIKPYNWMHHEDSLTLVYKIKVLLLLVYS